MASPPLILVPLRGFPVQYDDSTLMGTLNKAYNDHEFDREDLITLYRKIYPFGFEATHAHTEDGYDWLMQGNFTLDTGVVALLFPCYLPLEQRSPTSYWRMERCIGVYSTVPVPEEDITALTRLLATGIESAFPRVVERRLQLVAGEG